MEPGRALPLSPSRPQALTGHFQRLHEVLTELEAASRRLRRLEALLFLPYFALLMSFFPFSQM